MRKRQADLLGATSSIPTEEAELRALRAEMGQKAFYAALGRLRFKTIAEIPLSRLNEVTRRLRSGE